MKKKFNSNIFIDCLFFINILFLKFNEENSLYIFILFVILIYKKFILKDKLIIIIQIITLLILIITAFNNIILNYLYNYGFNTLLYSNYFYYVKFYFIFISLIILYLKRKKYENYLLILPFLEGFSFNNIVSINLLFLMIIVLLIKLNYKNFLLFLKRNFLYIFFISLFLYSFNSGLIYEYTSDYLYINKMVIYFLMFIITLLVLIYRNLYTTKILILLMLELVFLFPIYPENINYIIVIMFYLISFKIYKNKVNYKLLLHPIFISLITISIILFFSYYLSYNPNYIYIINKHNTFLFSICSTPLDAYKMYLSALIFFISFLLEKNNIKYEQIVMVFILSIFISEIVSYSIIFNLKDILEFFGITNYRICDPAPFKNNHIIYSLFLSLMILLLIDLFLKKKNYFLLIFLITATLNLFLNGGRVGQLSFILGSLVYFYFYLKNLKKFVIYIIALFSVIFLIFQIPAINAQCKYKNNHGLERGINNFNKIIKKNNYISSWGSRLAADISMLHYAFDTPKVLFFGVGGVYDKQKFMEYVAQDSKDRALALHKFDIVHMHNMFMQLLLDVGIIPVLLLLYIFYYLIKLKTTNEPLKYALLLIMFIFMNIVVPLFYIQYFITFLFVIIILLKLEDKVYKNQNNLVKYHKSKKEGK